MAVPCYTHKRGVAVVWSHSLHLSTEPAALMLLSSPLPFTPQVLVTLVTYACDLEQGYLEIPILVMRH